MLQFLGGSDLTVLHAIIRDLAICRDVPEFQRILSRCCDLLGAEHCTSALLKKRANSLPLPLAIHNHSYPDEWLRMYQNAGFALKDPVLRRLLVGGSLQDWGQAYLEEPPLAEFRDISRSFGLNHGLTHGLRRSGSDSQTVVSFANARMRFGPRESVLLEFLVGPIHSALEHLQSLPSPEPPASLTAKELEAIQWLSEGKSSWEIGCILGISERTVKFHLGNIYRKLGVMNRAQAVASAVQRNLLLHPS